MATTQTQSGARGKGWIVYSGIMLLLIGIKLFLDGLWALDRSDTAVDELYYETDLGTWGWIHVIAGVLIFGAGIGVFYRSRFAQVIGIAAAFIGMIASFLWLYAYPVSALTGVVLSALVIYGLSAYGDDEVSI
jgi:hypothetical protein